MEIIEKINIGIAQRQRLLKILNDIVMPRVELEIIGNKLNNIDTIIELLKQRHLNDRLSCDASEFNKLEEAFQNFYITILQVCWPQKQYTMNNTINSIESGQSKYLNFNILDEETWFYLYKDILNDQVILSIKDLFWDANYQMLAVEKFLLNHQEQIMTCKKPCLIIIITPSFRFDYIKKINCQVILEQIITHLKVSSYSSKTKPKIITIMLNCDKVYLPKYFDMLNDYDEYHPLVWANDRQEDCIDKLIKAIESKSVLKTEDIVNYKKN